GEKLPRKTHITKDIFGYSVADGHVNAIGLMSVEDLLPSEPLSALENLKLHAFFLKKSTILPSLLADRWFQGKIILKEEANILKELKQFTGKKRLYIFSTLSQAEDYSAKPGIVLDEGHVLYLNLNGCGLKQLPECITRLGNLIHLIVDDNQIIEFPESIGNLNQLQKLNFASNPLETLPERAIGQLIQLESIDGSYNNLATLPESIGNLSKLTTLNFENNQLTTLPESITKLKNLETFNLESNKLTRLPDSIGNLSNLRSIQLQNNLLEELPESLSNIDNLWIKFTNNPLKKIPRWLVEEEYDDESIPPTEREILTIMNFWGAEILGYAWIDHTVEDGHIIKLRSSYNEFKTIPVDLSELTHLESLSFDDNKLEELPSSVGNIKSLKVLQLNGNELKMIPNSIGDLENLEKLDLSGNQLESLPESIGQLRSLKELNLENNNLKELPASIGSLDQLEDMNLLNNPLETVPDTPKKGYFKGFWLPKQEIQALKDLETLIDKPLKSLNRLDHHKVGISVHKGHISGIALNSQGLSSLPDSFSDFTELQHLYLFDNKLEELPSFIGNFKNLRTLYLNENPLTEIPDAIISLPNLTDTDLARENRLMKSDYDALLQLEEIIDETIHEKDRMRYNRPGFKVKGGHISELNLYKFDLSSIPEPIRHLSRLKKLGLKRNKLTAIPDWLAELEELEEITFDDDVDEKDLLPERMKST
ncbi:MAG: leucine-rich repeat domain-containing protein, partial [Candidatus Sifarchaeia archaeon]